MKWNTYPINGILPVKRKLIIVVNWFKCKNVS